MAVPPFFMFATGIENSEPTIDGGRLRVDEMEKCGHYKHWREDLALACEIGASVLRYGPPFHLTYLGARALRLGVRRPGLRARSAGSG